MKLLKADLEDLAKLAQKSAYRAGEIIRDNFATEVDVMIKSNGTSKASEVLTVVDQKCQDVILDTLKPSVDKYHLAVLSEELEDDLSRLEKDYFWAIDPMDGTLAFTENVAGGSAVSIALVSKSGEATLGVVYEPMQDLMYVAIKGYGAKKKLKNSNWTQLEQTSSAGSINLFCTEDFLNHPQYLKLMGKSELHSIKVNVVCAGAVRLACLVLENTPAIFVKYPKDVLGGGCIWDYAATSCIFNELGLTVSDINSKPLNLNNHQTLHFNHCGVVYASSEKALDILIEEN